jgi:hypothetical protein
MQTVGLGERNTTSERKRAVKSPRTGRVSRHPLQDPAYPDPEPGTRPPSRLELTFAGLLVTALLLDIAGMIFLSLGLGPWVFYAGIALTAIFAAVGPAGLLVFAFSFDIVAVFLVSLGREPWVWNGGLVLTTVIVLTELLVLVLVLVVGPVSFFIAPGLGSWVWHSGTALAAVVMLAGLLYAAWVMRLQK